eukprot:GHVQ01036224.1.p1 GENE.GHVQ01036224.1~~GHVQ01036224.1.p1  ORF type:complete len:932 (+),score=82.46 GHVQ01036224.1:168-2963(+)
MRIFFCGVPVYLSTGHMKQCLKIGITVLAALHIALPATCVVSTLVESYPANRLDEDVKSPIHGQHRRLHTADQLGSANHAELKRYFEEQDVLWDNFFANTTTPASEDRLTYRSNRFVFAGPVKFSSGWFLGSSSSRRSLYDIVRCDTIESIKAWSRPLDIALAAKHSTGATGCQIIATTRDKFFMSNFNKDGTLLWVTPEGVGVRKTYLMRIGDGKTMTRIFRKTELIDGMAVSSLDILLKVIPSGTHRGITWTPNSKGVFYVTGGPVEQKTQSPRYRLMYHKLGTSPAKDIFIEEWHSEYPMVSMSDDGRYLIVRETRVDGSDTQPAHLSCCVVDLSNLPWLSSIRRISSLPSRLGDVFSLDGRDLTAIAGQGYRLTTRVTTEEPLSLLFMTGPPLVMYMKVQLADPCRIVKIPWRLVEDSVGDGCSPLGLGPLSGFTGAQVDMNLHYTERVLLGCEVVVKYGTCSLFSHAWKLRDQHFLVEDILGFVLYQEDEFAQRLTADPWFGRLSRAAPLSLGVQGFSDVVEEHDKTYVTINNNIAGDTCSCSIITVERLATDFKVHTDHLWIQHIGTPARSPEDYESPMLPKRNVTTGIVSGLVATVDDDFVLFQLEDPMRSGDTMVGITGGWHIGTALTDSYPEARNVTQWNRIVPDSYQFNIACVARISTLIPSSVPLPQRIPILIIEGSDPSLVGPWLSLISWKYRGAIAVRRGRRLSSASDKDMKNRFFESVVRFSNLNRDLLRHIVKFVAYARGSDCLDLVNAMYDNPGCFDRVVLEDPSKPLVSEWATASIPIPSVALSEYPNVLISFSEDDKNSTVSAVEYVGELQAQLTNADQFDRAILLAATQPSVKALSQYRTTDMIHADFKAFFMAPFDAADGTAIDLFRDSRGNAVSRLKSPESTLSIDAVTVSKLAGMFLLFGWAAHVGGGL